MKTKRQINILTVLAIAGLFLFSAALYAAKPAAQSLREKFIENVKYPDFNVKSGCCVVEMVFTISPEGKILIKKIIEISLRDP